MNEEVSKQITDLEARVSKLEQMVVGSDPAKGVFVPSRAQVSVVEFLREKKPTTAVDKALVFAVYHENQVGKDVFNTEDLLSLWRQAKEKPPANINDLINKNIIKGFMAEEKIEKGQKKSWYVTTSGSDTVSKSFQK
jgi:hypothetical protein